MPQAPVPPVPPVRLTRRQNILQTVKFIFFSVSAGLIQSGGFTLLNELSPLRRRYWPCYLISLALSVLWNFTLNRRFTFKSVANIPIAMLKVLGFYCVFTPLSLWWGNALTARFPSHLMEYAVLGGTMLANLSAEFLFYRFVVYRDTMNTNASGQREEARKR